MVCGEGGSVPAAQRRKLSSLDGTGAERQQDEQVVTFWGVRGTLPTPGPLCLKYGGHTSCVEVCLTQGKSQSSIVLDAGSGIVAYGDQALRKGQRHFHLLLSHMHYDHIIGLTRFAPLFRSDCEVTVYGLRKGGKSLQEMFEQFFSFPFFPVEFKNLPGLKNLHFHEVNGADELTIAGMPVQMQILNHPQDAVAYRAWNISKTTSVVYATDHEHGTDVDFHLEKFAKNATLMLYDSTYADGDYPKFKGWGHSTALAGAQIAKNANVGAYGLFHHDPDASDLHLEKILLPEAQRIYQRSFLCAENTQMSLLKIQKEQQANSAGQRAPLHRSVVGTRLKRG